MVYWSKCTHSYCCPLLRTCGMLWVSNPCLGVSTGSKARETITFKKSRDSQKLWLVDSTLRRALMKHRKAHLIRSKRLWWLGHSVTGAGQLQHHCRLSGGTDRPMAMKLAEANNFDTVACRGPHSIAFDIGFSVRFWDIVLVVVRPFTPGIPTVLTFCDCLVPFASPSCVNAICSCNVVQEDLHGCGPRGFR